MGLTSTTESSEFDEITQNNDHYAVQGHSWSSLSVPLESPYSLSYTMSGYGELLVI